MVGSALRQMDIASLAADHTLLERVGSAAAHPASSAQAGRVGGSPAHAFNEDVQSAPADACLALANWAISSLLRARAARIDGDFLVDA